MGGMKNWMIRHKQPILFGAIFLITIIILVIVGIIIFHDKHHSYAYRPNIADNIYNFLNEWASAFAPALTVLGIVVALIMSYLVLQQTQELQKKEHKEKLLTEIINWLLNIQKSSLEIEIPEIEKLKKYGLPFAMNAYIFVIIKKSFSVLMPDYLKLQDSFVGFMYLKYKNLQTATPKGAFEGERYLRVIDSIDKEINNKENGVRQMLQQYEHDLEKYTTLFLVKLADIKSSII
jgi:hypothetical protein